MSKGFGQGANDIVTCPKCGRRFYSKGLPRHAKKCNPNTDTFKGKYYTTSFCNFAHRLRDGMPVNHECYVLNPAALQAEMEGDYTFQPFRTERIARGTR